MAEHHPGLADLAPFLADLLAFVLAQGRQEVVEVPVSAGWRTPVELHVVPHHHAGCLAGLQVCIAGKQDVQGRAPGLRAPVDHRAGQCRPGGGVPRQQARTGYRREGWGDQRLGVVPQAVLLVGVGPGMVEHVFAVGVVLEIERARTQQCPARGQAVAARRRR